MQQDSLLPVSPQAPIHEEKEGSEKEADAQSCMLTNALGVHTLLLILFLQLTFGFLVGRRALHGRRRIALALALA